METIQTKNSDWKRLLKANEVASYLNISRSKVYSLMQRGELRTVRFGGSVRVRPEDLRDFIEQNLSFGLGDNLQA